MKNNHRESDSSPFCHLCELEPELILRQVHVLLVHVPAAVNMSDYKRSWRAFTDRRLRTKLHLRRGKKLHGFMFPSLCTDKSFNLPPQIKIVSVVEDTYMRTEGFKRL